MTLTNDQVSILQKCRDTKSRAIPIQYVQDIGYLFTAEGKRHELDVEGSVVKTLFEAGYLKKQTRNTCVITAAGVHALAATGCQGVSGNLSCATNSSGVAEEVPETNQECQQGE